MTLEEAQPKIIWPRLDRYKYAVLAKKGAGELDSLRQTLSLEISNEAGSSAEIGEYFDSQCDQIEMRHMTQEEVIQKKRGAYRVRQ